MKTIDISGLGGSYEATCQKMMLNGLKFLKDKPNFDWSGYQTYKNVYGVCEAKNEDAEALYEAIVEGVDPTGAMHQAVISHLAYICKHGHDAWIDEAERQGMKIYEMPSEGELENKILISQIEWQLKLGRGYNPMAELFKNVPLEDVITLDPNDPESIRKAAEEIARRMRQNSEEV